MCSEKVPFKNLNQNYRILAIGASAGGPKCIIELLSHLRSPFPLPVVIVQHMPPFFTASLADLISERTRLKCKEAQNCDILEPNHAYIAPGGLHMTVMEEKGKKIIKLYDGPMVSFVKPSVDVLFNSLAAIYKNEVLAAVLTGMGEDGKNGAVNLSGKGSTIFVQDEKSSFSWDMPGAVVKAGVATAKLSLPQMASVINHIVFTKSS
ncbi:MAG: hypothetical protein ACD_79C00020G0004 [uncultured bacterium]|nr:MAG: hypothetical protein ACD_79C00020G0004 [uncultured bacterium]